MEAKKIRARICPKFVSSVAVEVTLREIPEEFDDAATTASTAPSAEAPSTVGSSASKPRQSPKLGSKKVF